MSASAQAGVSAAQRVPFAWRIHNRRRAVAAPDRSPRRSPGESPRRREFDRKRAGRADVRERAWPPLHQRHEGGGTVTTAMGDARQHGWRRSWFIFSAPAFPTTDTSWKGSRQWRTEIPSPVRRGSRQERGAGQACHRHSQRGQGRTIQAYGVSARPTTHCGRGCGSDMLQTITGHDVGPGGDPRRHQTPRDSALVTASIHPIGSAEGERLRRLIAVEPGHRSGDHMLSPRLRRMCLPSLRWRFLYCSRSSRSFSGSSRNPGHAFLLPERRLAARRRFLHLGCLDASVLDAAPQLVERSGGRGAFPSAAASRYAP